MSTKKGEIMKLGRPKTYKKREIRKKTVRLNEMAFLFLYKVKEQRPNFDLSRYVSECIIRDFGDDVKIKKELMLENQKIIDALYRENTKIAEEIKILKDKLTHKCDI